MQAVLQRDTAAEVRLCRALRAAGLRFRTDCRPEPNVRCKADIVFRREKVCIFIDGCFWHRCSTHFHLPKTNSAWWDEKVQATVDRDRRQTRLLRRNGWTVMRVWEHELTQAKMPSVVTRVRQKLRRSNRRCGPDASRVSGSPSRRKR
ncbi:MAG: DNA mismatch endonuclease Vsr [Planctomycetes bacterium]|nr:DNA mismatch endonuclease Vsr [Planctomycetota bacterium]